MIINKLINNLAVLFLFISFSLSVNLSASKIAEPRADFVGLGRLKSAPDYIQVNFTVQSEYYSKPAEAQSATDETVKKIDNYLQRFKRDSDQHFKILVDGGYTGTYSRWSQQRELCRNTFQKSTDVMVKIGLSKKFGIDFADMQSFALDNFDQGYVRDDYEEARTFVRISTPMPQLTPEHRRELEREALNLAMIDAKANFKAAMRSCRVQPWHILGVRDEGTSFSEPPRAYPAPMMMAKTSGGMAESADSAAPLRFDDLSVEKRLSVAFGFEASMCYEP